MWPACYSSWFTWRNSTPCTCCYVISLEHDLTPWWENSQRIDGDATSFCPLWKLFTIIKIFSRRLELDGRFKHLSTPTKYRKSMFCEAVKVGLENSKELSFHHTITSTLSLITVLFEDLFEAITLHSDFSGGKVRLEPLNSLLNKIDTCDWHDFNIEVFIDEVNALQKELLMLFKGFCIFGYREFYKKLLCILMVVDKTIYGNNGDVPDILLNMFLSSSPGIRNHMNQQVVAPDPVFPQSYRTILNKQEFIIHNCVTRPVQYSLYTLPTMSIYDKPGAWWNRIDPDNYFTNYFKTNEMGDVVQEEKNLQPHNSWKRITLLWWQLGILKLFAQNQMKGHLLINVWWMSMKRAMLPFKQGIQNCSKMILASLRQVRNCWCACPMTSLMGRRIKNGLVLTTNGWPGWWSI